MQEEIEQDAGKLYVTLHKEWHVPILRMQAFPAGVFYRTPVTFGFMGLGDTPGEAAKSLEIQIKNFVMERLFDRSASYEERVQEERERERGKTEHSV